MSSRLVAGSQPSFSLALEGSPSSTSTSAGRRKAASTRTNSSQFSPAAAKAMRHISRTLTVRPVATT